MTVSKGEECTLLDNSRRTKWRVRNSNNVEGLVPAICFYIPPPNKDAQDHTATLVCCFFMSSDIKYCVIRGILRVYQQ